MDETKQTNGTLAPDDGSLNAAEPAPDAPREATEAAAGNAPDPRIAPLEQEKKELHDRMLRIAADFENYKKRSRRELEDGERRAREEVLRQILPVADNLERALGHSGGADDSSVLDGIRLVLRQLAAALEKLDVRPIEVLGRPFDPNEHEAIQHVEAAGQAPGSVIAELQRGYTIGGRLLRPALVTVAKAPAVAVDGEREAAGGDGAPVTSDEGQDGGSGAL